MLLFLELELSLGVSSLATLNHMGNDSGSLVPARRLSLSLFDYSGSPAPRIVCVVAVRLKV